MKGIKTRERILNGIKVYIAAKGYSPTIRELCEICNIKSTSTVHGHLEVLKKEGVINKIESHPRTISIKG